MLPVPVQFPKQCRCCARVHSSAEAWAGLRPRGRQADAWEVLEYRDCTCGSTLAVVVQVLQVEAAS
jgi:hypothetical protein